MLIFLYRLLMLQH